MITYEEELAFIQGFLQNVDHTKGSVPAKQPYLGSRDVAFAKNVASWPRERSAITPFESARVAVEIGRRLGYAEEDIAAYLHRNFILWIECGGTQSAWLKKLGLPPLALKPHIRDDRRTRRANVLMAKLRARGATILGIWSKATTRPSEDGQLTLEEVKKYALRSDGKLLVQHIHERVDRYATTGKERHNSGWKVLRDARPDETVEGLTAKLASWTKEQ